MDSGAAIKDLKVSISNKQILSISLPISLAILVPQINMLTNSIFLGNLSEQALGNAGITGVFYLIFAVAGHGLNNAMQSIFSKNAGANNTDFFKVIFSQGVRISLLYACIGIAFTWLFAPYILEYFADPKDYPQEMSFLRIRIWGLPFLYLFLLGNAFLVATLNSKLLIFAFICEASVNIILDYLLIFGKFGFPALGFNGAAIASVIAEMVGMIMVFSVIYLKGLKKQYGLFHNFLFNKKINKEIIHISTPLMLQYIISVVTWLVFFFLIEERGSTAKAISNTMRNVFGLAGIFVWAFAGTSNVMVSNLIGQNKEHLVMTLVKRISLWSFSLCLFICFFLNFFTAEFFLLFGQEQRFVDEAAPVIRTVTAGLLVMSMANIWLNAVTGTGKTRYNLMIEIVAIFSYLVYTWIFMKKHYISLSVAWSNEIVYWFIILIISFFFIRSGKWKSKNR
jgi:MATE family multidrug resistance protein